MSWNPSIWIDRLDFDSIRGELEKLDRCSAWEFSIGKPGVVLVGSSETTQPNRDLHDLLVREGIAHWIIDGEGQGCDECKGWGAPIELGTGKPYPKSLTI